MDKIAQAFARLTKNQKIGLGVGAAVLVFSGLCCCPVGGWFAVTEIQAARERAQVEKAKKDLVDAFAMILPDQAQGKGGVKFVAETKKGPEPAESKITVQPPLAKPAQPTLLAPDQSAMVNDFKVSLLEGAIGQVEMHDRIRDSNFMSSANYATVYVRLTNTTKAKLLHYQPWTGKDFSAKRDYARLRDEHGNRYKIMTGSGVSTTFRWQLTYSVRLDPEKAVSDLLIFEAPIPNANEFTLDLPGLNIGAPDTDIVYKIPRSWFKK